MDEKMRLWLSAGGSRSNPGKWIWKNKVVARTFKRSPKLIAYIREKHFRPIIDKSGALLGGEVTIPQGCAVPFIRRLTKGILYLEHPEYDYFYDHFTVNHEPPTEDAVEAIGELVSHLQKIEKGGEVFRVWHGITRDTGTSGVCVYLFYAAVCFVCFFGKDPAFKQQFQQDYSEESGYRKAFDLAKILADGRSRPLSGGFQRAAPAAEVENVWPMTRPLLSNVIMSTETSMRSYILPVTA
jgi:hypothetical protein